MKKYIFCLLAIVSAIPNSWAQTEDKFYYVFDKKIPLVPFGNKITVVLKQSTSPSALINSLPGNMNKSGFTYETVNAETFMIKGEKNSLAELSTSLKAQGNVANVFPVYQVSGSTTELGVTNDLVIKFKNDASQTAILQSQNKYQISLKKKGRSGDVYRIDGNKDVLETANKLQESGLVEYAHPDFLVQAKPLQYIPNDPFFDKQFSFHNTGQIINDGHTGNIDADVDAPEAWDITKGSSSIVVAVIDEGVTDAHPDLPAARQVRLPGSNFAASYDVPATSANDPSPILNDNHGNSCAGVIAATQDNNEGITGIAPNCKIMPIRIPLGDRYPSVFLSTYSGAIDFAWMNGADVISNSWGFGDPYGYANIATAIYNATQYGRGGLGSVVLIAASNTADHANGYPGFITFPGNVNIPGVLTVGASERYDMQANYSPTSDPVNYPPNFFNQIIDVVAPSHRAYPSQITGETFEVWSMDIPGNTGYNPWPGGTSPPLAGEQLPSSGTNYDSYTGRFGGTSAATPITAGVAALTLSINPALTQQQVFDIITCTAEDVGGYTYSSGFSNEMGNGRVNAFNSVMGACPQNYIISWLLNTGTIIKYQAGTYITAYNTVATATNVEYHAGTEVTLTPGFEAIGGTDFTAFIQGCVNCTGFSFSRIAAGQNTEALDNLISDQTEGTSANKSLGIRIFPNPTQGFVTLQPSSQGTMQILNTMGQEIYRFKIKDEQKIMLDLSEYPKGFYYIKFSNGEDVNTQKIVLE